MMILSKDTNPERQVYYLGSILLEYLIQSEGSCVEVSDLYDHFVAQTEMSAEAFFLTLDWLFLLETVELDNERIQKCF